MNKQELLNLILSDQQAKSCAIAGNDMGCAQRCSDIAPKIRQITELTERGLYQKLGPVDAETILQKLENYNGIYALNIKRVLEWLKPQNGGLDFASVPTLQLLGVLTQEGVLTPQELSKLDNMSYYPQIINTNQVSDALAEIRRNGGIK